MRYIVRTNKFEVSDPYHRMGILPSKPFNTGIEVKKFIESETEKYKSTTYFVLFEVNDIKELNYIKSLEKYDFFSQ